MEVISEGVIEGLSTGDMRSVFLDKTPVLNHDLSSNFNIKQFTFRNGMPDQETIPGFAASEAEYSVGVEMKYNTPLVRRVNADIDAIRIKIRLNSLFYQSKEGDMMGTICSFNVDMSVNGGGYVLVANVNIDGKTMSPYERSIYTTIPPGATTIDIRMTKITPQTGAQYGNTIYWSSYTEIIDGKIKYDDTAVVGMAIDAQYFPNVPSRAYLIKGILCQIPSNYNPITRGYTGDWDGTFRTAWTDNPAWVLFDLLTNDRYGVGGMITNGVPDKWGLYECSKYNDELVPDGKGGMEPRFTCNLVITKREDAYRILGAVASCMWALLYYSNGTIFVVQDRPDPNPYRLFGPSNVVNGLFDYTSTDYRSRFTAVNVMWNDPSQNYEPAADLVIDPVYVARFGYWEPDRPETTYGVTGRGQAIRHGRRKLYICQNEDEVVGFRVTYENADIRPGQVVYISDPSTVGARLAGRTIEWDVDNQIALDQGYEGIDDGWTIYAAVEKSVYIMTVTRKIEDGRYQVSGKPPTGIPGGSQWIASDADITPTMWRVISVKNGEKDDFDVTAVKYTAEKYPYVDYGMRLPPPITSLIPTGPLLGPSDVNIKEYIYLDSSGTPQFGIVVSWQLSTDSRVSFYILELAGPNADKRTFLHLLGTSQDVPAMRQGTWTVYLTAVDNLGRQSKPFSYAFTTIGLSAKPAPPLAFHATPQNRTINLTWIPSGEIDVMYYWIAWCAATDNTSTWEKSITVQNRIGRNTTNATVPFRRGTYSIKAVDSLGQTSSPLFSTVFADLNIDNFIANIVEDPSWSGVKNLWTVNSGELNLSPPLAPEPVPPSIYPGERGTNVNSVPTRYSYYEFANIVDLGPGNVAPCLIHPKTDAWGSIGDVTMSTWKPLAAAEPLAMGESGYWDMSIEYSITSDLITWTEWKPFQATNVTMRAIKFRIVGLIYDLQTTINLLTAEVLVDVPDRTERGTANVPGGGSLAVVYQVPFAVAPKTTLTALEDVDPGGSVNISNPTKNGFTVQVWGRNGNNMAGTVDWQSVGYGESA
jgi:predicted phage tail protein